MLYFIDSNIFLRFFIKEDEQTAQETKRIIGLIKEKTIKAFSSHLVIAETDWAMKSYYKISKEERIIFLNSLLQLNNLSLVDKFDLSVALSWYKERKVKFIDCLLASNPLVNSGKATVISYDKDFDKLNVRRILPDKLSK